MQWSTFSGLFRVHGTKPENEPWSLGEQNEQILKDCIKLRYSLIPYIYSYSYKMNKEGAQLLRPMVYDYPRDSKLHEYEYQYMFGNLLAAPVVEPDKRIKNVYLPQGAWYDFYTGIKYLGQREIQVLAPINKMPLLVKENSIVTLTEPKESVHDVYDKYVVNVYGRGHSTEVLYEDDGMTYGYQEDIYNLIRFTSENDTLIIETNQNGYKKDSKVREIEINWYYDNKNLIIDVDVANSMYNGEFIGNLVIKNETGALRNLKIEIQKPEHYFVQAAIDLPESLDFSSRVKVEDSAEKLYKKVSVKTCENFILPFKPYKYKMPQLETIKIRVLDEDQDRCVFEKDITIGNGYIKNWFCICHGEY